MAALGRVGSLAAWRNGTRDRLRREGQWVVATQAWGHGGRACARAERLLQPVGLSCAERPPPQHPCGRSGAGILRVKHAGPAAGLSPALGPAAVQSRPRRGAEVQSSAAASALTRRPLHFPEGPGAAVSAGPVAWTGGSPAGAVAVLLLTGQGAALLPPRWCCPWRWSRRTGSRGPAGAGVNGCQQGPAAQGALGCTCSPWPAAARGLCGPLRPPAARDAGPSCSPPA